MKKLLLLLLLMPLLANAAKWTKVGSDSGGDVYIDKASIIKGERGHKVWSLVSYGKQQSTPDGKPYLSIKALHAYSCEERTATLLTQIFYAEAMGKGAVIQNFKYEKFSAEDIVPDSAADSALQVVCQAKPSAKASAKSKP
jgi:hypothetical protein